MKNLYAFIVLVGTAAWLVACDDNVEHPCGSDASADCLKNYLSKAGHCSVVNTPTPNPYYGNIRLPLYVPVVNITGYIEQMTLGNLDGVIEEFSHDKKSGNIVITVRFTDLFGSAPDTIFVVERDGMEPKVIREYANATYPVVLTAVIPASGEITKDSLKKGHYSGYFPNSNAMIGLGPQFTDGSDPDLTAVVMGIMQNVPVVLKELFRTKSQFYFLAYLQEYLCNYYLNLDYNAPKIPVVSKLVGVDTADKSQWKMPCGKSSDLTKCASQFFKKESSCTVPKTDDTPVTRDLFTTYIPLANSTVQTIQPTISGLNGKIETFYIDEKTNNLVLSAKFDGIVVDSPNTKVIINRRGKEPTTINGYAKIVYPVSLTGVIPLPLTSDSVREAFVSARVSHPGAQVVIGDEFQKSKDPQVAEFRELIRDNPEIVAQEFMVESAYSYFYIYLQKYICDFGISSSYSH